MPNESDTVQFVKEKLKTALTGANVTALDHAGLDASMQRWLENWIKPAIVNVDAYKLPVFETYGIVHYTPKDGDTRPRYGVQAILNGPLFESRKDFRSMRLAKLWIKQQMKCVCWPTTTQTQEQVDDRVINMSVTFDYEGPLDKTRLDKNDSFR